MVTPNDLRDLQTLLLPIGSNAREKEEIIILNWIDYIFEAEGI